jgi:hypothetical protein
VPVVFPTRSVPTNVDLLHSPDTERRGFTPAGERPTGKPVLSELFCQEAVAAVQAECSYQPRVLFRAEGANSDSHSNLSLPHSGFRVLLYRRFGESFGLGHPDLVPKIRATKCSNLGTIT